MPHSLQDQVDLVGDRNLDDTMRLDPVQATLSGYSGFDDSLPDYSPDGWAARAEVRRTALHRLNALTDGYGGPGPEPVSARILRERLEAELAHLEAGLASALTLATSPPVLIRECLSLADPASAETADALARRLAAVPGALMGYLRTVCQDIDEGRSPQRRQAQTLAAMARIWGEGRMCRSLAEDLPPALGRALRRDLTRAAASADAAYAGFADRVEREVLPRATGRSEDPERYAVAARWFLGADLDARGTYDWLTDRLRTLRLQAEAVAEEITPGLGLVQTCALLDSGSGGTADNPGALVDWVCARLDAAFDAADGVLLDIPPGLRSLDVVVEPSGHGSVRYLPPAADPPRSGRLLWPLPEEGPVPLWSAATVVHHEGVPGHHLQMGLTALDPGLSAWRRRLSVPGHAEGWAVYAEGLMAELNAMERPEERLGLLMGLRANTAVALADIGMHTGLPVPPGSGAVEGERWTDEATAAFLGANTSFAAGMLDYTVLRGRAWPGQALAYACGERAWRQVSDRARRGAGDAFDRRAFHARALALGPCGLSVLEDVDSFQPTGI